MPYGSYCTQIGPDGSGHERCGGACLASVLLDDGWESDPWQLTVQVSNECGFTDQGATSAQVINCAAARGLDGRLWYSIEEARAAIAAGEAVLCLLDNRHLTPRAYPPGDAWNAMHWVRVVVASDRDDMVYLYDPLAYLPQPDGTVYQGPVASDTRELWNAIMATGYPEAGVILTSRQGRNLNAR